MGASRGSFSYCDFLIPLRKASFLKILFSNKSGFRVGINRPFSSDGSSEYFL